jgi:hypothetical protein
MTRVRPARTTKSWLSMAKGVPGTSGMAVTVPVTAWLVGNVSPVNYELSLATAARIAA